MQIFQISLRDRTSNGLHHFQKALSWACGHFCYNVLHEYGTAVRTAHWYICSEGRRSIVEHVDTACFRRGVRLRRQKPLRRSPRRAAARMGTSTKSPDSRLAELARNLSFSVLGVRHDKNRSGALAPGRSSCLGAFFSSTSTSPFGFPTVHLRQLTKTIGAPSAHVYLFQFVYLHSSCFLTPRKFLKLFE